MLPSIPLQTSRMSFASGRPAKVWVAFCPCPGENILPQHQQVSSHAKLFYCHVSHPPPPPLPPLPQAPHHLLICQRNSTKGLGGFFSRGVAGTSCTCIGRACISLLRQGMAT